MDRAALDLALQLGIPHGGWCPEGRKAEDGPLPPAYRLQETPSAAYGQRTRWNVRDSDGTLVLTGGAPRGGTALTISTARRRGKPFLTVDLRGGPDPGTGPGPVREWLTVNRIQVLNVAGPRESEQPGIYSAALAFLGRALSAPAATEV